jgi:hypothetical protein
MTNPIIIAHLVWDPQGAVEVQGQAGVEEGGRGQQQMQHHDDFAQWGLGHVPAPAHNYGYQFTKL